MLKLCEMPFMLHVVVVRFSSVFSFFLVGTSCHWRAQKGERETAFNASSMSLRRFTHGSQWGKARLVKEQSVFLLRLSYRQSLYYSCVLCNHGLSPAVLPRMPFFICWVSYRKHMSIERIPNRIRFNLGLIEASPGEVWVWPLFLM